MDTTLQAGTKIRTFEDATYRKVSWRLVPFLMVCFLIAYLDRVNVGFAKLQMSQQLGFSETVYGLGANALEAVSNGTSDGLRLAVNVGAMLLVFTAMVAFVNWLLSREGQLELQKFGRTDAHNSRRIHIPTDAVDPYNRLEEGKKYFDLARPEYQDLTSIFKLVKEVLPQK